ncbi:hypothetical protein TH66_00785 [Carbonactinospora thermoautotrophica]|uniref:MvdD-like pre-ATP grasp domain-containing protein n=1 Tax=Carbonactinospora thermoautotrophica TaxID=1469144 RepID=A0A132NG07_9ACTN|nr:ATP-grasp ribosomal peptide maturase [Carbonactinospora thermoautotrophica]KWX05892.1 hypothetical protein TH66_00785 [Carbonactinospora thermoautotrophica]KWX09075.1 hypothetical protein TR74_11815 [Carbonactinospora thermoautotrophica]
MILVLSQPFDATTGLVLDELKRRSVPVVLMDVAWFPAQVTLAAHLRDGNWDGYLRLGGGIVELTEIRAVYYRKPGGHWVSDRLSPQERVIAEREARIGFGGLLFSLEVFWLPHPARVADAEYKPAQLAAARRAGLAVPDTLITNRPDDARAFVERHNWDVVYKTLTPVAFIRDGSGWHTYTTPVTPRFFDDDAIRFTAHLFQRCVHKEYDVRLVCVGDRMFAVEIDSPVGDWRRTYDTNKYRVGEVPDQVAAGMRALLKSFGLNFCAADFAVDHDGLWWFLDLNPNGQWAWLEQATGVPISRAIADLLERNAS